MRFHTASGASNYIGNMVARLVQAGSGYTFLVMRFEDQRSPNGVNVDSIICPRFGLVRQVLWDQTRLPGVLARHGVSLYHPLKFLGALRNSCPQVAVAHSITTPFRGEFPTSRKHELYWNVLGNRLYRSSAHVIAVSDYVREFLLEGLGIPTERITVVHNGRDERFRRIDDPPRPANLNESFDRPYVLAVGNMFPVKNHVTTVRAFARVASRFPDHVLVMAGGMQHAYFAKVRHAVEESGVASRIRLLGFVDAEALLYLYNRADALVMPSLTEGCPITLVEAMACGLPVVGSRRGGIAEVGGDAIRLIDDPMDVHGFAAGIADIIADRTMRAQMAEATQARVVDFTWPRAVQKTLAVYDRVLGGE